VNKNPGNDHPVNSDSDPTIPSTGLSNE